MSNKDTVEAGAAGTLGPLWHLTGESCLCRQRIFRISTHLQEAAAFCLQLGPSRLRSSFEGTETGMRLFFGRLKSLRAREMAQRLSARPALAEGPTLDSLYSPSSSQSIIYKSSSRKSDVFFLALRALTACTPCADIYAAQTPYTYNSL